MAGINLATIPKRPQNTAIPGSIDQSFRVTAFRLSGINGMPDTEPISLRVSQSVPPPPASLISPSSDAIRLPIPSPSGIDIWHDFRRESSTRACIPIRARCRQWKKEVFSLRFLQALLGEFFGMTIFLTMVTLSIVYSFPSTVSVAPSDLLNTPRIVLISTVFGLTIAVLVFALSTSSGGHLNPAVSFALLLRGAISLPRFVGYVLMQMSGACAGAAYTKSLNVDLYNSIVGPDGKIATACNRINYSLWPSGMGIWTAFGAEMFATTVLCWAVLASGDVGTLPATRRSGALNPLSIGLAVLLAHLCLIPIDGTSINPARSFGTAAIANFWTDQWLFWVAPITGSIIACISYELFFFGRRSHAPLPDEPEPSENGIGGDAGQESIHQSPAAAENRQGSPPVPPPVLPQVPPHIEDSSSLLQDHRRADSLSLDFQMGGTDVGGQ